MGSVNLGPVTAYAIALKNGFSGTETEWLESLKGVPGPTGPAGKGMAIVYGEEDVSGEATYIASGEDLPDVMPGSGGGHKGKGTQIVFIPRTRSGENPSLKVGDGAAIQIRLRAGENKGENELAPDATSALQRDALLVGVPYTMTFCGIYWLIDSYIDTWRLRKFDEALAEVSDAEGIGVPALNNVDANNAGDSVFDLLMLEQSAPEKQAQERQNIWFFPTVDRVREMLEDQIGNINAAFAEILTGGSL